MKVTNTVRQSRRDGGVTQEGLADALGVSRQTIISIEKGRYIPSLPLALKLAAFFERQVEQLFKLVD